MDKIDTYRVFVNVVECASFTRAADKLNMPRSTVSTAIYDLERRMGVHLLHRTTRKVSPTIDGMVLYEKCQNLLEDIEYTENLFRQSDKSIKGRLKIDVPGRIGRLIIAPALPSFFEKYPNIEIFMGVTDRPVNLIEESVDCALRVGELVDSQLIARRIGNLKLINVASADYVNTHGKPINARHIKTHKHIKYASPGSGKIEDFEWQDGDNLCTQKIDGNITVNNAEAYIACCLAGQGVIQIPEYDVRKHIKSGELVEVLEDFRAPDLPINLLYTQRRHISRRLSLFTEWLYELLKVELG